MDDPKIDHRTDKPKPMPERELFQLNKAALKEAVRTYLEAQGYEVPQGKEFLWGLERPGIDDEPRLTFAVETTDG